MNIRTFYYLLMALFFVGLLWVILKVRDWFTGLLT